MLKNLAEDLAQILAANNIIKVEECDAYRYGLELAISKIIMYTIILIIAILTKTLLFSSLFAIMYVVLRQYTGGYHCKSAEMCIIVSIFIYLLMLLVFLLNLINIGSLITRMILLSLTFISPLIIVIFSPVESSNNPLTKEEKNKYHRNSIIVAIILLIISCVSLITNISILFYSSSGSLTADAVLIILSLRRSKNEKNCYESDGGSS